MSLKPPLTDTGLGIIAAGQQSEASMTPDGWLAWWSKRIEVIEEEAMQIAIERIDVEDLANILMDMRVDSPRWKPPSTLTYRQASQELARRIIKELSR
jgi:hypothetical protein